MGPALDDGAAVLLEGAACDVAPEATSADEEMVISDVEPAPSEEALAAPDEETGGAALDGRDVLPDVTTAVDVPAATPPEELLDVDSPPGGVSVHAVSINQPTNAPRIARFITASVADLCA